MTRKIYPGVACRLEFFAEDSDGLPVPSLTHSDVSAAAYCNRQDGVLSSATSVSLTSSVAATAAVSAGQFVTINSARGHYAIDAPSGAAGAALDYAEASVTFSGGHTVTAVRHEIDLNLQYATSNVSTLSALSGRIPAALVSGRMDCSVGVMASNVITAAAIAADAGAELAALVEAYIVNEGDATAVLQAVADKIAADWVAGDASPLAIAAAVWAAGSRTITGGSLTTAPPTAAAIADAVWDEARTGHATAGTFGFYLDAAISGISGGGGGGTDWTADERAQIRYQLGIDGTATAPTAPVTDPVVITPSDIGKTTLYALCVDRRGAAKSGVVVHCWLAGTRPAGSGIIADNLVETFTSGVNGVVQIPDRMLGFSYAVSVNSAENPVIVRISPNAGGTTAIPDLIS